MNLQITPHELFELINTRAPIQLIDVREIDEFNLCKIEDSFNIPLSTLLESLLELDNTKKIITICHHGVRSLKAAMLLKDNGFENVESLQGGVNAWAQMIDPLMTRY